MAFWGLEVKSGRPCTLKSTERKRLHLSQATLGIGNAAARSILQCNVGSKSPVFLCSLSPDKIESCQLHMEFQEAEDVTFSVLGPNTIHLTGYFLGKSTASSQNDDESESYGEDVGNSDMDKGSSDDDYDCGDSFINDDDSSACRLYPSSTDDDEVSVMEWKDKKANRDGNRRRLRKKFQVSDSESDKTSAKPDDSSDGDCVQVRNIEDGLKISTAIALSSSLEIDKPDAECEKAAEATAHSHMTLDTREDKPLPDVKLSPLTKVSKTLSKKRRKKEKSKKSDVIVVDDGEGTQKPQSVQATDKVIEPSSAVLLSENGGDETPLKKRRRKNKTLDETTNVQKNLSECLEKNKKNIDEEAVTTKSLELVIPSNEVVIEEIAREHLDGKVATDGKKVSINYTGKLKDTEKPFQSNLGGPPFRFRLGEKNVIKGLSIGIEGMRVGDKRRLVIPPSLGYAEKGLNEVVPKNAWLVYEVEAVKVR